MEQTDLQLVAGNLSHQCCDRPWTLQVVHDRFGTAGLSESQIPEVMTLWSFLEASLLCQSHNLRMSPGKSCGYLAHVLVTSETAMAENR